MLASQNSIMMIMHYAEPIAVKMILSAESCGMVH